MVYHNLNIYVVEKQNKLKMVMFIKPQHNENRRGTGRDRFNLFDGKQK